MAFSNALGASSLYNPSSSSIVCDVVAHLVYSDTPLEEEFPHVKTHHQLNEFIERYDIDITTTPFTCRDWKNIKSLVSFSLDVENVGQIDNHIDNASMDKDTLEPGTLEAWESALERLRSGDSDEDPIW